MKKYLSFAAILLGICCSVLFLCACGKKDQKQKRVNPETLRLMQKTQSELTACVDRCRSAAEQDSENKEIYLALANSQQVLVDRHETIINILLKKFKWERVSTIAFPIEMDPRTIVLPPLDEYRDILANGDPQNTLREILIALEITNKVLESDQAVSMMINPDAEEAPGIGFYLCPVCGHLTLGEPEENCPVCHSDRERQIGLKNGELPPREKNTFVTVSE
ncbi:MAG: hypothetical protein J6Y92_05120 [Lentisphaeria bacterium]|nr:hypothetical protein [Lentisphaeria bacterium]